MISSLVVPRVMTVILLLMVPLSGSCQSFSSWRRRGNDWKTANIIPWQPLDGTNDDKARNRQNMPKIPRGGGGGGGESSTTTTIATPHGINPLVVAAPFSTAAVCRDGLVLVALHPNVLVKRGRSSSFCLTDLPRDFAGPFRIQSLDMQGSTILLTAGWRADAQFLCSKAQEICRQETEMVGSGLAASGRFLAWQFSLLMATCSLDGDTRELHCAALLASAAQHESLWLVDATGAYAVRAIALGGGTLQANAILNDELRQVNWRDLTAKEGLQCLLELVEKQMKMVNPERFYCVEAAIVDFQSRRLVRKFLHER